MKVLLFCHSLVSDWNHGNAHFLRGVVRELLKRGHEVQVYEPHRGWSIANLVREHGTEPLEDFRHVFPGLKSIEYDESFWRGGDLEAALDGADVALVHEWNAPELVAAVGAVGSATDCRLFFHDTHHRSVTAPKTMAGYDLSRYDGVLAFGEAVRLRYLEEGWVGRAWTWHEAADVELFRPLPGVDPGRDVVWIGNWGDDERTAELERFLLGPVHALLWKDERRSASAYGVRYPQAAVDALVRAGLRYDGWLPNVRVPEAFALHRVTVHVPRGPYVEALPGIPTIRVFEALACGIPLVCSPWDDVEGLFSEGEDYLVAHNGAEMEGHLEAILSDPELASSLSDHGRRTVLERHTCAHRVDELLDIVREVEAPREQEEQSGEPAGRVEVS